jgi:hypothetical protein
MSNLEQLEFAKMGMKRVFGFSGMRVIDKKRRRKKEKN